MSRIYLLSDKHNPEFNPEKLAVVVIRGKRVRDVEENLALFIEGVKISVMISVKLLGLVVDRQLKFIDEINSVIKKHFLT